jgi:hypothetical protein
MLLLLVMQIYKLVGDDVGDDVDEVGVDDNDENCDGPETY